MYFRDFNQHSTYFSQGIIKARQAELYNLLMFRFNNLENGETINISLTDDAISSEADATVFTFEEVLCEELFASCALLFTP